MSTSPEGNAAGLPVDLSTYEAAAERHTDVVDEEAAAAEWKEYWGETLDEVQSWGPKVAKAYARARAAVGNETVTTDYDGNGEAVELTGAEVRARELQPDILIVDIIRRGRNWRSPIKDTIDEKVASAGWVISRREYDSPDEPDAEEPKTAESPAEATDKVRKRTSLLEAIETDDDEDDDTEHEDEKPEDDDKLVELVVLMQDGKVVRMEGKSDAREHPDRPLRFARIRPDKTLKKEDKPEFERQSKVLKEYQDANAEHFVQPGQMDIVAILDGDTIENADLGEGEYELTEDIVYNGLVAFLTSRKLVRPAEPQPAE